MTRFDLIEEGWLPLQRASDGWIYEVGIAAAVLDAHEYTELATELPTQVPALLRQVLLPVVADALGAPADRADWGRRFAAGAFSQDERERLRAYLDQHRDRFDLFHDTQPFAQAGRLEAVSGDTKGSGLLVATMPTGNNVPLFASRTEGDRLALTPAQAARWLLHTQCWDTAAIKTGAKGDDHVKAGKTTGNPTGPLGQLGVLIPSGRTLYETLLLNIPIGSQAYAGVPQWRVSPIGPAWDSHVPAGLLELWTWQSRRIRLICDPDSEDREVTRVVLAAGDRVRAIPEWEPHTAWAYGKPAKKAAAENRRPRRHVPGKALWRGLQGLLATELIDAPTGGSVETSVLLVQLADLEEDGKLPAGFPLRLDAYGLLYGNQSAIIEDLYYDRIPLPVAALRADAELYGHLLSMAAQADQLAQAVNYLSADLRRAAGLDPIPWDKAQRPGEQVLHALNPVVRRVLAGMQRTPDEETIGRGLLAWEQTAHQETRRVAGPLFATLPESVFGGRHGAQAGTTYSLGTAEDNFRTRLTQILPVASQARR